MPVDGWLAGWLVQAIELPEHDSIFSLKSIKSGEDLEAVREGQFEELAPEDEEEDGVVLGGEEFEGQVGRGEGGKAVAGGRRKEGEWGREEGVVAGAEGVWLWLL